MRCPFCVEKACLWGLQDSSQARNDGRGVCTAGDAHRKNLPSKGVKNCERIGLKKIFKKNFKNLLTTKLYRDII